MRLQPADLMSTLPDISPNYKPLPKIDLGSPSRHSTIEQKIGVKSHARTQVYSGRRNQFLPAVPTLYNACLTVLQDNLDGEQIIV